MLKFYKLLTSKVYYKLKGDFFNNLAASVIKNYKA